MLVSLSALVVLPLAASAQFVFRAPSSCPTCPTTNYVGGHNTTLQRSRVVPGRAFDRFIHIWLENTDFDTAAGNPVFQQLAKQGLTLTSYYGVAHPSQENYLASTTGSIWGLNSDDFYHLPENVSTIVDCLEEKDISWASYQENMPTDGFPGFSFASVNYVTPGTGDYTFYMRKHNHLIVSDSVALDPARASRIRTFEDFGFDVNASAIPQYVSITPNMQNDCHDTDIEFCASWLQFFLLPMLENKNFNDENTIIVLTFDENDTDSENNNVFTLVLGGGLPDDLRGKKDDTFLTHYTLLSTIQANWGLRSLGRQDTNRTVANVLPFVADKVGYRNEKISGRQIPLLNSEGGNAGPLNPEMWTPVLAPDIFAVGAGGPGVIVGKGTDLFLTHANPVNLTAKGITDPETGAGVSGRDEEGL